MKGNSRNGSLTSREAVDIPPGFGEGVSVRRGFSAISAEIT